MQPNGALRPAHRSIIPAHRVRPRGSERQVGSYFKAGKLKHKETVVQGIDNAVGAFIGLFQGRNIGKMVVELG